MGGVFRYNLKNWEFSHIITNKEFNEFFAKAVLDEEQFILDDKEELFYTNVDRKKKGI